MTKTKIKTIAILTGGGDCPGLNAVIRAVTKTAVNKYKLKVYGIEDSYLGLIENRIHEMNFLMASGILTQGGTILGSNNRSNPFKFPITSKNGKIRYMDVSDKCIKHLKQRDVDALICIGGDGTMCSAADFAKKGITVIGIPKTIDNDLYGTDVTFGFDTAVNTATEAIDKLHTTASSHHRVMIAEVMGRYAGWIALHSGVASGADVILLPEMPYDINKVCKFVLDRSKVGKQFSIVVVSEGAKPKGGKLTIAKTVKNSPDPIRLGGVGNVLANQISDLANLDCRATILGHIQRGGSPTPHDRVLGTAFGYEALELLVKGVKNHLVVVNNGSLSSIPLSRVAGKIKTVKKNHQLVKAAKAVNTCFGD